MFKTVLKTAALAFALAASTTASLALDYGWTTAGINFRSGPSTYYEVLGQISPCTKVEIAYKENNWYNVRWNGHEGWVAANYVAYDEPNCGYVAPSHTTSYKPAPKY